MEITYSLHVADERSIVSSSFSSSMHKQNTEMIISDVLVQYTDIKKSLSPVTLIREMIHALP